MLGYPFPLLQYAKIDILIKKEEDTYCFYYMSRKVWPQYSSVVSNMSRGRIKNLKVIVLADPIKLVGSSPIGAAMKMYDTVPFSISLSL